MTQAATTPDQARERLCLALDVPNLGVALRIAEDVSPFVGWVKVGLQLYTAYGPEAVLPFRFFGQRVFLDLKLHDIPNTVASAVPEIAGLGAELVNVHALGGRDMIAAAVAAADQWSGRFDKPRPKILAVTLLTSLGQSDIAELMASDRSPEDLTLQLAMVAREAGADGVVASPAETLALRAALGSDFLIVTPGIREQSDVPDDQQRTATVAGAIAAGSDLLVIGRPILRSPNRRAAARTIRDTVAQTLESQVA
ncbi:MAG: orotidine-5'-phosphate decarboxylase [Dehalococcoidia bacterium]